MKCRQKDVAVARDRAARQINQEIVINARTEQVQNRIVEAYLDVYEDHVIREAKDRLDEFQRQHPQDGLTAPRAGQPVGRNGQQVRRNGHTPSTYVRTAQLPDGTVL